MEKNYHSLIKSKHNTFGFWTLTLLCTFTFLLFLDGLSKSLFGFGFNLRNGESSDELHNDVLLFFGLTIFWSIILSAQLKNITIDLVNKTISFQNIFTRKSKVYLFSDFDGYINTAIPHDISFYPYNTIGLVKDKRILRRIDKYYYSNVDELKSGLNEIKDLGEIQFNVWGRVKMMLKFPVL
jgi:hypothetical protein